MWSTHPCEWKYSFTWVHTFSPTAMKTIQYSQLIPSSYRSDYQVGFLPLLKENKFIKITVVAGSVKEILMSAA